MKYSIAIHGGAGTISRKLMSDEKEKEYSTALSDALKAGSDILERGGSSLDAVCAAVISLENSPLFNAGKGSVFTAEETHEMDASVMRGDTLDAGAVSGIKNIKNPVLLAKTIMEKSEHVYLSGSGAEKFAKENNIQFENDNYFYTSMRFDQLKKAKKKGVSQMDHSDEEEKKFGTVGAVALDSNGNLAACTSTGGMTNKNYNRVGDTPLIGAGTYANNKTCAVSCTGNGEYFIRAVVAHDVSCMMEYGNQSLKDATEKVVMEKLISIGGEGGLIAVDKDGNISMTFNSEGMYRASKKNNEEAVIKIFK